ncbi:hypothetical protein SKAU_G00252210 [Synaphobranchus kaupii]|uniref:Uncharacterized protein n=1 Tax=Synaphobranchus kaupii TaxID=118154 RepID=A0A9Q1IR24_SYNKA|nr:hypothetical protein SKAU_G00252210 [Synaphobranchus kaupii]
MRIMQYDESHTVCKEFISDADELPSLRFDLLRFRKINTSIPTTVNADVTKTKSNPGTKTEMDTLLGSRYEFERVPASAVKVLFLDVDVGEILS